MRQAAVWLRDYEEVISCNDKIVPDCRALALNETVFQRCRCFNKQRKDGKWIKEEKYDESSSAQRWQPAAAGLFLSATVSVSSAMPRKRRCSVLASMSCKERASARPRKTDAKDRTPVRARLAVDERKACLAKGRQGGES